MYLRKDLFPALLFALIFSCSDPIVAQNQAQADGTVIISDASPTPKDIYTDSPTLPLILHSPQAHPGNVWLRSSEKGLDIWGKVDADEKGFRWPRQKSEMLSSDHIEIWLAASPDVLMPVIGWGNQFGVTELDSAKDCSKESDATGDDGIGKKNCERWFNEQIQYRQYLRRLFTRQWLIAGGEYPNQAGAFEDFATTAYAGLNANLFHGDLPILLRPKEEDGVVSEFTVDSRQETRHDAAGNPYSTGHQTGYRFHVFIPYAAFPPAQELKLSELYLMVDVFAAAPDARAMGEYSSTSATRIWGKPSTFNHVRVAEPRTFSVTPCEEDLDQNDLYGENYRSWFFPGQSGKDAALRSTFALINPAGGYMYEPARVSPSVTAASYFWKPLVGGATVCGPHLAWQKGGAVRRSKFEVEEKYFEAKALPDGWNLIRSGPMTWTHSRFGSGACGSCEVMGFSIFSVSPQGEIEQALDITEDLSGTGEQADAADLSIAQDWKRITLYREFEGKPSWTSTTYCLEGHQYTQCGESKQAKPPDPPNFKELRGDNN